MICKKLGDRLFLAPVQPERGLRILDVGTGETNPIHDHTCLTPIRDWYLGNGDGFGTVLAMSSSCLLYL